MSRNDIRKHIDVPKKPIEILHINNRLGHKLFRLEEEYSTDSDLLNKVFVEIDYNNTYSEEVSLPDYCDTPSTPLENNEKQGRIYLQLPYKELSKNKLFKLYIEALPVLDRKTEKVSTGTPKWSRLYSLKSDIDVYITVHHFRVKYLPLSFISHPLYKNGLLNELLYDMIVSNPGKSSVTVIGSEAYPKMISYIREKKYVNAVINKSYKKYISACKDNKTDENKFLEYVLSDLCGVDVGIRRETGPKGETAYYIVYKK